MFDFPANPTDAQVVTFPEGPSYVYNAPSTAWDRQAGATATPPPTGTLTVTSLSPDTSPIGELGIKVTITGTRFSSSSIVNWDGNDIRSTFVNATTLEVNIYPELVYVPGAVDVFVKDGTDTSNSIPFTYTAATAVLTSISPTSAEIGGPAIPAKAYGTGFNQNTIVVVSGSTSSTNTQYVSPTELTWSIVCQFETTPRTAQVTLDHGSGSVPLEFVDTLRR